MTFLHFEGVFHHATLFLNGQYLAQHEAGYTPFTVRLDNATGLVRFGEGRENVLALRADASFGSGHWYEGGGIYRPVHLVHVVSKTTHVVRDGLFVSPESDGAAATASLEIAPPAAAVRVAFTLLDVDGTTVLATATTAASATATMFRAELRPADDDVLKPWSLHGPTLYTVRAQVVDASSAVVDEASTSVGFRTTSWTAAHRSGFSLNGDVFKLRGFSHHNSIGGLGVAIPERINLFRVQAARALGSNIWRMSHNPYSPHLYDLLDIVGLTCWDENRDYGAKYNGGAYARQMHDMVKRDRNHPSIIVYSFCNEYECQQNDPDYSARAYREAAKNLDPDRVVSANDISFGSPKFLDVQGCSHAKNTSFEKVHTGGTLPPDQPLVLSECCSCTSQRPDRSLSSCIAEQNSPGLLPYVAGSLGVWTMMDYIGEPAGTGTSGWPHVSSDFGNFDIAGFPKPHAYWYSANWLQAYPPDAPGRPPLPARTVARVLSLANTDTGTVVAITTAPFSMLFVDGKSLGPPVATPLNEIGEVNQVVFTLPSAAAPACGDDPAASFPHNASRVQCKGLSAKKSATSAVQCAQACCDAGATLCNTWQFDIRQGPTTRGCWIGNVAVGSCRINPEKNTGIWSGGQRDAPPPAPTFRNATLVALSSGGKVLATHTVLAAGTDNSSYILSLALDVPSASTGTGTALLLDGRDTALLRCSVLDQTTTGLVTSATNRISWKVVSGPGRLDGISNGDPTSHEQLKSTSIASFGGLARAMVKVTLDCTTPNRDLAAGTIDVDRGPATVVSGKGDCDLSPIVVEASSPGMVPVRLSIPVSADVDADSAFAIAKATAGGKFVDGFSFLDNFVG